MGFKPLNHFESVDIHRRNLPHWEQEGTMYFVTARLADSVPRFVAQNWRRKREAWLRSHHTKSSEDLGKLSDALRQEYHQEFTSRFHELLDAGHGECLLQTGEVRKCLAAKLSAGHEQEYLLDSWVIMPNHFHALVEPLSGTSLARLMQRWKGGSAREINQLTGRSGTLWQSESFDHIVRSEAQRDHFRRYIAINPEKAGLGDLQRCSLGVGQAAGLSPREFFEKLQM